MTDENIAEITNHLDLFSGIGGFALAACWCGFNTVGFSEIDPYASAVLKKNFPTIKNYGDIRTITRQSVPERIEIITGGFPCQPFSTAGKRRGKEDHRDLWPEMFRVIKEFKPTWVLGENVAGFVNMELDRTITDLEAEGYEVQPLIIPACAVGAPHRRDRVWIVAHADGNRWKTGKVLSAETGERGQYDFPSYILTGGDKNLVPNPGVLEWMMGYPIGWTDCTDSETP